MFCTRNGQKGQVAKIPLGYGYQRAVATGCKDSTESGNQPYTISSRERL